MTQPTPLLSRIPFGALLTYSPRGTSPVSLQSRTVAYQLKSAKPQVVERAVEVLRLVLARGELTDFFGKDVVLVPAPRSSPLEPGWLWPAESICLEMVRQGLGAEILSCITRTRKVAKSAYARPGERPTVKIHLDSLEVNVPPALIQPARMTIVDDVVTKGATLLACASLLQATFQGAAVSGFGVIRTRGLQPEVDQVIDPCVGEITWDGGSVYRQP